MTERHNDITVLRIHSSNRSKCLRRWEEDGSSTGSLLAELNDLLRLEFRRDCGTAKADDGVAPLITGDF